MALSNNLIFTLMRNYSPLGVGLSCFVKNLSFLGKWLLGIITHLKTKFSFPPFFFRVILFRGYWRCKWFYNITNALRYYEDIKGELGLDVIKERQFCLLSSTGENKIKFLYFHNISIKCQCFLEIEFVNFDQGIL